MLFEQHDVLRQDNPMTYLIIGVDPGKTAALACVDLHGKTRHLSSMRFADTAWFIDTIRSIGSPVVIASDKKEPNRLVAELASMFDAVLFTPESDVTVQKKKELTREEPGMQNLHERDALAAAKIAYFRYANKLNNAERNARERNFDDIERLQAMVLKKYSMSEVIAGEMKGRRFVRS